MKSAAAALLVLSATLCFAQKLKINQRAGWVYRNEASRVNTRGCSNLTLVLDNWKYTIMTQIKDLLLHDHNTVLPEYGRIQLLSATLGDLYKEFNALKEDLAELMAKFDGVETFVDDMRSMRKTVSSPGGKMEAAAKDAGARPQGRRRRVVIRRIRHPAPSDGREEVKL